MSFLVWTLLAVQVLLAARVAARMLATARGVDDRRQPARRQLAFGDDPGSCPGRRAPAWTVSRRPARAGSGRSRDPRRRRRIARCDVRARPCGRVARRSRSGSSKRRRFRPDGTAKPGTWRSGCAPAMPRQPDRDRSTPTCARIRDSRPRWSRTRERPDWTRSASPRTSTCLTPRAALLHPSMLTTLVYRFGIPGCAATSVDRVQANGQCFFASRELLVRTGAIAKARDSRCEDVTIARVLAASGTPGRVLRIDGPCRGRRCTKTGARRCNWPRSLTMLDRYSGAAGWIGLLEVLLVQALPPWIAAALLLWRDAHSLDRAAAGRARRAGRHARRDVRSERAARTTPRRATYWLSPLADLPVAVLLFASALRRRHTWRGRALVPMEAPMKTSGRRVLLASRRRARAGRVRHPLRDPAAPRRGPTRATWRSLLGRCRAAARSAWSPGRWRCWRGARRLIGWRRTLIFAAISCAVSAAAELTGTKTGLAVRRLRIPDAARLEDRRARPVRRSAVLVLHGLRGLRARAGESCPPAAQGAARSACSSERGC